MAALAALAASNLGSICIKIFSSIKRDTKDVESLSHCSERNLEKVWC